MNLLYLPADLVHLPPEVTKTLRIPKYHFYTVLTLTEVGITKEDVVGAGKDALDRRSAIQHMAARARHGVDRLAMLKYGMDDLRAFFDGDQRWLDHYGFSAFDQPTLSAGVGAKA